MKATEETCSVDQKPDEKSNINVTGNKEDAKKADGVDVENVTKMFPERQGNKTEISLARKLFTNDGKVGLQKLKCERNVYYCIKNSPMVKLMIGALKTSGCELDLRRHISCEMCSSDVTGGYDPVLNQVVVCQNMATSRNSVSGALSHEFLHMFDYCRAKLDFENIEHLACTEIRAANLLHCSYITSILSQTSTPFHIAKTHRECVKAKALASVLAVRKVTLEEAAAVVDKVFDKCYNDLEPVGRRIRRNSLDIEKAYRERHHYGYY